MNRQSSTGKEIHPLKEVLTDLRQSGKVLIAILYGSYAWSRPHARSDIDLAVYLAVSGFEKEIEIIDGILMSIDREISILRLDDEEESPFIIQAALKGIHLVVPDRDTLYDIGQRVLHECESIRFRRELSRGEDRKTS